MSKYEFMNQLKMALEGQIPEKEVFSYLSYYEDYFKQNQTREKEVIEELGEPRLLAKTIIESYQSKNQESKLKRGYANGKSDGDRGEEEQLGYRFMFQTNGKLPLKYKIYGIIGLVFIIFILYLLLRVVFTLAIKVVLPILILVLVIMGISYLSKK